jgi:SOS response regulatory protein OraA/RecX
MRPTLTALRRAAPELISLEIDGRPWRTVPDSVVVRAGLAAGVELDREKLRAIRRELGRARGFATAGRILARRDVSARVLTERVERRAGALAGEVVTSLEAAGIVDDGRSARARASALADRGWGDAAIAARLESEGFDEAVAREAIEDLPAESERAPSVIGPEPNRARAARLLARRGFAPEIVEETAGALDFGP